MYKALKKKIEGLTVANRRLPSAQIKMPDPLEDLTEEQKEVVLDNKGVIFVAAAAGSGKTRTLTHNVAYLIQQGKNPSNILCFTFTRRAADEMRLRLVPMIGRQACQFLNLGTIHSIYLKILSEEYQKLQHPLYPFMIIDGSKIRASRILDDIRRVFQKQRISFTDVENTIIIRSIGLLKSNGIRPDQMDIEEDDDQNAITIQLFYAEYEKVKLENRWIDFDDMLLLVWELFEEHPEIAEQWSRKFEYIFVDEFQDTNPVQAWVLEDLIKVHGNMKAIGDPRQAIYGFRGATPVIFENYDSHYDGARLMSLSRNVRCPSNICKLSNDFVEGESNPLGLSAHSVNPDVGITTLDISLDTVQEAENITEKIHTLLEEGAQPHEITILYRVNAQSADLEDWLIRAEIPYRIIGAGCFFDRREIKDMLAYLMLSMPYSPEVDHVDALERIYNKPNRWLGRVWLEGFRQTISGQRTKMVLEAVRENTTGRLSTTSKTCLIPLDSATSTPLVVSRS